MNKMNDAEFAAYVAGFTDGEGYIGLGKYVRGDGKAVRIVLANCVQSVLLSIKRRLGYGWISSQQQKAHWRRKYTYQVSNFKDCEHFINMVWPYLQVKRPVARQAMRQINRYKKKMASKETRNQAIRDAAKDGKLMRKEIAAKFKVSPQLVSLLLEGHKWPSVMKELVKNRKRRPNGTLA